MGNASVSIQFEVASSAEARTVIAGWTLSPGCSVMSSYNEAGDLAQTDDAGNIVPVPTPEPDPTPPDVVSDPQEEPE
jgi:hypothetical protein